MNEIKTKAQAIVDEYNILLFPHSIRVVLSKKYCEVSVGKRDTYHPDAGIRLLNEIDAALDRKKEQKYRFVKNRYHSLVLSITPTNKSLIPQESCKDYAFILHKIERPYIGEKPQNTVYEEDYILKNFKKKLQKILKKAQKTNISKTCKNTIFDAVRYCILPKYFYKNKILGKDRFFWDIILIIIGVLLGGILIFLLSVIGKIF